MAEKKPVRKPNTPTPQNGIRKFTRGPLFWIVLGILAVTFFGQISSASSKFTEVKTSQILDAISKGQVATATVVDKDQIIKVELSDSYKINGSSKVQASYIVRQEPTIIDALTGNPPTKGWNVLVPSQSLLVTFLFSVAPFLIIALLFFWMMSQANGGGRAMQFGKSRAKLQDAEAPKTTFADVAGADEAVQELEEIRDFLSNSAKYRELGAKIPKGVLLYGPPGTGKTLLARAVAGEAKVPFYSISGSDFVEMFVGVGAARVRDLFNRAKETSPAIVFVDEIDAVGRQRGAGLGGGHDEREQTLNQLLVEMDGFDDQTQVILIAATNRPDVLDPALLRPGRFDRQIPVERPDLKGREAILKVHSKNKPLAENLDLTAIARRTPGFTGADLANVLNEAALLTARNNEKLITLSAIDESIDRVMAGPQKKTRVMSDEERRVTAYHEGGHALVAHALPHTDPVHKITIMPRGRALGYTMVLPDEDKYSVTRNQLLDQLSYTLGGRAAEELIFHDPSTGASNDIEKATALARQMVTQYGMTETIGAVKLGSNSSEPFLGRDLSHQRDYSENLASIVDNEIRKLIDNAHQEAFDILEANRAILDELVLVLLEKETILKDEIQDIFKGVKAVKPRPAWTGSNLRKPSSLPPVAIPVVTKSETPSKPVKRATKKKADSGE
ncbi:MAG: ATP-dependent zinc metalloprotease FtsH [Candidatus Nanopelagicaceae bacterium]